MSDLGKFLLTLTRVQDASQEPERLAPVLTLTAAGASGAAAATAAPSGTDSTDDNGNAGPGWSIDGLVVGVIALILGLLA